MAKGFYVVKSGRNPGIYSDYESALRQTRKYPKGYLKGFATLDQAEKYMGVGLYEFMEKYEICPSTDTESINDLCVYPDGICKGNGRPEAIAGVGVYFGNNDPRNISEPLPGPRQTNQRADLTSILRAIQKVSQSESFSRQMIRRPIRIFTKSSYAIHCLTRGYLKWLKNGWKSFAGHDIKNRDLIEEILEEIRINSLNVCLCHISRGANIVSQLHANSLANKAVAAASAARNAQDVDSLTRSIGTLSFLN
ncbi:hypothetical protein GGI12_002992 [Dipsacomyces acuminosporus]|nr:hypothetical protein GGI12_002992 [Dipsacomyces acuminosporus]